jgi:hypothetical protein
MKSLLILIILFSQAAESNDGIAGFKGGKVELNFHSDTNVSMKSEVLKISRVKVDVDYIFYNNSKRDEEVLVAFPFSGIDCGDFKFDLNNQFTAAVNGESVSFNEEMTIKYKGKDISQEVKNAGIKLCRDEEYETEMIANIRHNITNPKEFKFNKTVQGLIYYSNDKKLLDKFIMLSRLGYIVEGGDSDGKVMFFWGPDWKVSKKAFFKVKFPGMTETRIQHSYVPWTGSGSYMPKDLGYEKYEKIKNLPVWAKGLADINKNPLRYEMEITSERSSVEYILKTAKTWKGPIQNFKLIIDRSNGAGVSNYVKDYKLEGNNLIWETKDFIPKEDLVVSFSSFVFNERKFTGKVSEVEKRELASMTQEYNSLDSKSKESIGKLVGRFKAYIAKYSKSKNLPQAFSMLDYLENDIE